MSHQFWLGALQTAFGSGLGFILGIGAFHYQQHRQRKQKEDDDRTKAIDALNRLTITAGANIEALANMKSQSSVDLNSDVQKMSAAIQDVYNAKVAKKGEKVLALKMLAETLTHFYKSLQKTSVMSPPEFGEYSQLTKRMPHLSLFVHRALVTMTELNERIESRNTSLSECAREGGTGDGMTAERIIYYSGMLSGEGNAVCKNTDYSLFFWRLVLDQVEAYTDTLPENVYTVKFQLKPEVESLMPPDDLLSGYRENLETFNTK